MPKSHRRSLPGTTLLFLFILIVLCGNSAARAQRNATASKAIDLSVFGGFSHVTPDYGPHSNSGFMVGADYTRHFGWRIDPSFEIRANRSSGDLITEESLRGGLRLATRINRFHPYVAGFAGVTKVLFKIPPNPGAPKYTEDEAFSSAFGGGVDVDIIRHIQAKFDYQREFMNFGPNSTQPGNSDFTLSPSMFTMGAVYHF